jgi:hypothetical protein
MRKRNPPHVDKTKIWRPNRKSETARRIEIYSSAYKQIPPTEKRARPDISLRIHASIRRQLKAGAKNPNVIAFEAVKDVLVPDTHYCEYTRPLPFCERASRPSSTLRFCFDDFIGWRDEVPLLR